MAQNLTYTQCGDYLIPGIRLEHKGTQLHTEPEEVFGKLRQTAKIDEYPALH